MGEQYIDLNSAGQYSDQLLLEQFIEQAHMLAGGDVVVCEWCGETFEKLVPGADVCGNCQIAEAVKLHWRMRLVQHMIYQAQRHKVRKARREDD